MTSPSLGDRTKCSRLMLLGYLTNLEEHWNLRVDDDFVVNRLILASIEILKNMIWKVLLFREPFESNLMIIIIVRNANAKGTEITLHRIVRVVFWVNLNKFDLKYFIVIC